MMKTVCPEVVKKASISTLSHLFNTLWEVLGSTSQQKEKHTDQKQ